jgi:hypothetical protein
MSSFKVVTTVETVNNAGTSQSQTWIAAQGNLDDVIWKDISISKGAVKFVWNPTVWADFSPSLFSVLALISDGNLDVEMTINSGDADVEYNSFRLVKDTPFVLGADAAYYDHSAISDAAFGGTLDVIDAIRVAEPSTAAVNLTMIMSD